MAVAEIVAGALKGINNIATDWANFLLQKSNFDYQKKLQNKIFEREDSAWQRAVADIKKAGLSTTMLSGGAGTGATVNTTAPQLSGSGMGAVLEGISQVQLMKQTAEQTKLIKEQQEVARTQKEKLDNDIKLAKNADERADKQLENTVANTNSEIANREGRLLLDTDNSRYNNALVGANTKSRLIANNNDAILLNERQRLVKEGLAQPEYSLKRRYGGTGMSGLIDQISGGIADIGDWFDRRRRRRR